MGNHADDLIVDRPQLGCQLICRDAFARLLADEYNLFTSFDLFRLLGERFERYHTLVHTDISDYRDAAAAYQHFRFAAQHTREAIGITDGKGSNSFFLLRYILRPIADAGMRR